MTLDIILYLLLVYILNYILPRPPYIRHCCRVLSGPTYHRLRPPPPVFRTPSMISMPKKGKRLWKGFSEECRTALIDMCSGIFGNIIRIVISPDSYADIAWTVRGIDSRYWTVLRPSRRMSIISLIINYNITLIRIILCYNILIYNQW